MFVVHNLETNLKIGWVHIPRTGGTSFAYLIMNWEKSHSNIKLIRYEPHCFATELGERDITFATVRNPWDRIVSLYGLFKRSFYNKEQLLYIKGLKIVDGVYPSFKYWCNHIWDLRYGRLGMPEITYRHLPTTSQCDFLRGKEPEIICRFENLGHDMRHILDMCGITDPYPHENSTVHDHYSSYYDSESREMIADIFKEDIHRFGYSFETV